jgi:hypothetical protein
MVRKFSQDSDSDCSEPRTTAMCSLVMDNSIVFNKARTCMKDNDLIMGHSYKDVKPFPEIPVVCAKPLSINGNSEETSHQKMEKLKRFRQLRKELVTIEQCRSLSDIQMCLQEKEFIENVKMFNKEFNEEEIMGAAREPLIGH